MKFRNSAVFVLALLTIFLLSGCSLRTIDRTLDAAENAVEQRLDRVENKVEDAVKDAVYPDPAPQDAKPDATSAQLTAEEAQAIALNHAELTAEQVSHLRAEFEIDDRIPHYDVQFRQGQWEYEYEIHGETGDILSYDKDM